MPDKAESYAKIVASLSRDPLLKDLYAKVLAQVRNEGLLETVVTRLAEHGQSMLALPAGKQPRGTRSAVVGAVTPGLALANSKGVNGRTTRQRNALPSRYRQIRRHPKVVIPVRKPVTKRQGLQKSHKTASEALMWRAVTESTDNSENEGENEGEHDETSSVVSMSEDELLQDTPRPAIPAPLPSVREPACAQQLQHIDWIFWIQADEVGYWRPLTDFPHHIRELFTRKFNADYLQKSYHVEYYARMLRNRETYLPRDRCVGNITHANRNKASKWTKTGGDKEKTCDTCFRARRFCARVVDDDGIVKLGFFPLPESCRVKVMWKQLHYWVRKEKVKKD